MLGVTKQTAWERWHDLEAPDSPSAPAEGAR
jgi:hypothetical protein